MTKTPRQEEILNDLVELLDVDEDQLTTPTQLFTELPTAPDPNGFVPDSESEAREVKIINTDLTFWIFPSLEIAEGVNQTYARYLVDHGKVDFSDQIILNSIDSDLIKKYVYESILDREDAAKLSQLGPEAFLRGAEKFADYLTDPLKVEETYVPDQSVKDLQKAVAKAASKYPFTFLRDNFGEKQALHLLIQGVGFTNESLERLTHQITFEESLKPLNVGDKVGQTRYGLTVVQVNGKPIQFTDISKMSEPF